MNILGKRSDLPFSRKSHRKKERSTVSFTHVQNIICSQTQLESIAHEQTIICRQLFAGHVVGSWPMKRKKNLLRMIINYCNTFLLFYSLKPRSQAWILIYRNWSKRNVSMARFLLWNFFFLLSALTQILLFAKGGMSFLQERGLKAELLPWQLYNMPLIISVPSSLS